MRLPRFLLPALLAAAAASPAKELTGVYEPAAGPCPTADEAIAKMTVPDGYEVRNFAAEPMVINPVAMSWDRRGRLWVVELYEYPSGAKVPNEYSKIAEDENFRPVAETGPDSPRDRVVILEDTDNDGKADKRTVFVEGLNLATALLTHPDGLFVGQAPNLFFFRDTDGDDRADEYKTVLTGFGLEDRHELLNSFTEGPDGWMYFTHGVFTHSKVRRPGTPESEGNTLNAGVYRVSITTNPGAPGYREEYADGPQAVFHEVFADGTSNPWGIDFDARGNAFVEACVIDHLFHMAPGGIYDRQGGAPEHPYAYELLPSIVPEDHPGHFRAAYAGIQIYKDTVYPADTHGHLFFGNIHDNAIHEEVAEPAGASFKAKPVRDLLRANNGWFRPVSVQTGPDGFLWVMDWCDKYPCYQNAQANPEGVDREKGRIWRICYTGSEEGRRLAGMSRRESDEHAPEKIEGRTKTAQDRSAAIRDRTAAIAWLMSWGQASRDLIDELVTDPSFEIRVATARGIGDAWHWCQTILNEVPRRTLITEQYYYYLEPKLALLAGDSDPTVRAEAVIAMRRAEAGYLTLRKSSKFPSYCLNGRDLLTNAVTASADADRTLAFHIWMALEPRLAREPQKWLEWLAEVAPRAKPLTQSLTYKSARRIVDTRSPQNMDLLFAFLEKIQDDPVLTAHALDGMLKAQEAGALKPAAVDPAPMFAKWKESAAEDVRNLAGRLATLWGDPAAIASLMGLVLDAGAPEEKRIDAIRTVRRLRSDEARAGMVRLLASEAPPALTTEALRAAAELGGRDLADAILNAWTKYPPPLRTVAAEVMVSRPDWAARLLDGVEGKWTTAGAIPATDIPATARRVLATGSDEALRSRAETLLGAWNETTDDIRELIAAKRELCLGGTPDFDNGRQIFTATCAVCHPFHGGGQEVGPDLIGSGRSNLDALLANVIDPNQVIGNGYQNFVVITRDGRTLTGRIVEDTPTQITLLGIAGRREVVPVGDIAQKIDTGMSAMPMGFGGLPDKDFRDLIWFVLAPPEEGLLTVEKRHALSHGIEDTKPKPAPDPKGPPFGSPDRESASLWQPDWRLDAPDFEGTPTRLTDYHGRNNVLALHPFDRSKPAALVRRLTLPADKPATLSVEAASHDLGDWTLRATVDGQPIPGGGKVGHDDGDSRWHRFAWDLSEFRGREIEIRLENFADDWMYEFSYWSDLKLE